MMCHIKQKMSLGILCVAVQSASFAAIQGITFEHKDWTLACDNTGTCRAVGYQSDENEFPVSVLLTRKAGENTAVIAEVQFGEIDENQTESDQYELKIDGKSYGDVQNSTENALLKPMQLQALLASAQKNTQIEFVAGKQHYILSGQGMSAVLLKMDEFQKRVGTSSALIKKGKQSNHHVLAAEAKPIVIAQELIKAKKIELLPKSAQAQKIIAVLRKTTNADDCPVLFDQSDYFESDRLVITPLTKDLSAVSNACWKGAYNFGWGTWVLTKDLSKVKQFVSYSINDELESQLFGNHKGRGVGDCWSQEEWTWNGQRYIQTLDATTGQCKGIAGGAWQLPTVIADIKGLKH